MPVEQVLEFVASSDRLSVDRESGLIRGVKILGLVSANKRRYSAEAVRQAVGLYEGVKVNVNHPAKAGDPRDARDRFGRLVNVEARADGLYGNLEYLKSHPLAASISEAAERMPSLYGLSHVAECNTVKRGKESVIEGIKSVLSVDLVSDPATTQGIFEGKQSPMPTPVKSLLEGLYPEHKGTIKLMEEDGMLPAEPMAMPAEASADDQASAAFKSMVVAVLDDSGLDVQGKLGKIREILKAQEKLSAKAEEPAASDSGESSEEKPAEGKQPDSAMTALQEQVRKLTAEKEVRKELKATGLGDADDALLESLVALPTAEARKPILASLKKATTEQKPRSGYHVTEGKNGNGTPKDVKAFVSAITTRRR